MLQKRWNIKTKRISQSFERIFETLILRTRYFFGRVTHFTTQKMSSKLRIWSHLLKKSLMENFIFCSVLDGVKTFWIFLVILLLAEALGFLGNAEQKKRAKSMQTLWSMWSISPMWSVSSKSMRKIFEHIQHFNLLVLYLLVAILSFFVAALFFVASLKNKKVAATK